MMCVSLCVPATHLRKVVGSSKPEEMGEAWVVQIPNQCVFVPSSGSRFCASKEMEGGVVSFYQPRLVREPIFIFVLTPYKREIRAGASFDFDSAVSHFESTMVITLLLT